MIADTAIIAQQAARCDEEQAAKYLQQAACVPACVPVSRSSASLTIAGMIERGLSKLTLFLLFRARNFDDREVVHSRSLLEIERARVKMST